MKWIKACLSFKIRQIWIPSNHGISTISILNWVRLRRTFWMRDSQVGCRVKSKPLRHCTYTEVKLKRMPILNLRRNCWLCFTRTTLETLMTTESKSCKLKIRSNMRVITERWLGTAICTERQYYNRKFSRLGWTRKIILEGV